MGLMPEDFEPNTFYIDSREHRRFKAIENFLKYKDNPKRAVYVKKDELKYDGHSRTFFIAKPTTLEVGDYAFMNEKGQTIGFEYKTIGDFDMSINLSMDNLFRKCEDLCRVYDSPHLIIQGDKQKSHLDEMKYEMTLNSIGHSLNIREPRTFDLAMYHMIKSIMNYDDGRGIPRNYCNRFYNEALNAAHSITGATHTKCKKIVDAGNFIVWQDIIKFLNFSEEEFVQFKKAAGKKMNHVTLKDFKNMQDHAFHKKLWDTN